MFAISTKSRRLNCIEIRNFTHNLFLPSDLMIDWGSQIYFSLNLTTPTINNFQILNLCLIVKCVFKISLFLPAINFISVGDFLINFWIKISIWWSFNNKTQEHLASLKSLRTKFGISKLFSSISLKPWLSYIGYSMPSFKFI